MTFKEYIPLAQRTDSNHGDNKMSNALLGMVGELGEALEKAQLRRNLLDDTSNEDVDFIRRISALDNEISYEIGDICWYVAEAAAYLDVSLEESMPNRKKIADKVLLARLIIAIARLSDAWKKHLFQGHEFDRNEAAEILHEIFEGLQDFAYRFGRLFDFSDYLELNIEKLRKRYPDGFEAERSINRD